MQADSLLCDAGLQGLSAKFEICIFSSFTKKDGVVLYFIGESPLKIRELIWLDEIEEEI